MVSDPRCFFCFVRAFERLLEREKLSSETKSSFINDMISLYQNSSNNFSAPIFSRELHHILRGYTNNPDPYVKEKKDNNEQALRLVHDLEKIILQSNDPFKTALRIAIAGNIIDFAPNDNFNIHETVQKAINTELAIDHSESLKKKLKSARTVLYLGDNAGEIVFDKIFIKVLNHPGLIYVVRGGPILNDATIKDAELVNMKEVAGVISNGFDAPSTIPEKSSREFQEYFTKADIIISKGQGNLEGLVGLNDQRIYFLLMVKCDVFSDFFKVEKNSLIVYNPSVS